MQKPPLRTPQGKCAHCRRELKGYYSGMYHVYLLECDDGSIYTGISTDVARRFDEHTKGKGGHFTSSRNVTKILYSEPHENRSSALKREAEIKGWRREKKLDLVRQGRTSK